MGLLRKAFSVGTLGMTPVGFNSKKEKIVANTRKSAAELRKQTRLLEEQNRLLSAATEASQQSTAAVPADRAASR